MKSSIVIQLSVAFCLSTMAASVMSQPAPGDDPFSRAGDMSKVSVPATDTDGDGCLSQSELEPGSQLSKRFATRDANGDGKLCKDEYFFPG